MSIKDKLTEDMKANMKSGHKARLSTIRQVLAAIQRKTQDEKDDAIKKGKEFDELSEEQVLQVIKTYKKNTEETLDGFVKRNKPEDAETITQLKDEIIVVEAYIPKGMSKEEIKMIVDVEAGKIELLGQPLNKGTLMKPVMAILKGKADNKIIGEVVDQCLSV